MTNQKLKKLIFIILSCLVLVILLFLVIFGFGIYKFNWQNKYTKVVTGIIPYPVAIVNGQFLSFHSFQEDVETFLLYYQKQKEQNDQVVIPTLKTAQSNNLDRMIKNTIEKQELEKRAISFSKEEIDAEMKKVINEGGGEEKVKENLKNNYNWTPEIFKEKVVIPFIYERKLSQIILEDENFNQEAKEKAGKVLEEVKKGEKSFEDLAKEYSDDSGTAQNGGDLSWFAKGVMIKEFEDASFALEQGQVSELVKTIYGYHLIKILEKRTNNEGGEEVHAQHILIQGKTFEQWIDEMMGKAKIVYLISLK